MVFERTQAGAVSMTSSVSLLSQSRVLCLVVGDDLVHDETVYNQEEQSSQPYLPEGVVALKLQEVCRSQPHSLGQTQKEPVSHNLKMQESIAVYRL